jgi:hypothetical protein
MIFKSIFMLLLVFTASCTYYNEEELYPDETCDTTNISYKNDVLPVFQKNCYTCHYDNTTYGNLDLSNFVHIQRVVDNGNLLRNIKQEPGGIAMPQGGAKLPDCTILKIEQWINLGIPNN